MTELSIEQTVVELGVSRRQVNVLVRTGRLLAVRQDPDGLRRVWIDAASVAAYKAVRRPRDDADHRALRARMRRGER